MAEKKEETRTCPFWEGPCHPECMLYISRTDQMTAKCAIAMIATLLESEHSSKTSRPGLGI